MTLFRNTLLRLMVAAITVLWLHASCSTRMQSDPMAHERLFLEEFLNHSVLIRGNFTKLEIYKGDLLNEYFFNRQDSLFNLTNDRSRFNLADLQQYSTVDTCNREEYVKKLEERTLQLLSLMKESNVLSFTSEFRPFGFDLKIYLKEAELNYVPDTSKVTNQEWYRFLKGSKKIKDGWYLYNYPD